MFDVTFVSPDGVEVASFTYQTRRQVQLLLGTPPRCAVTCGAEMRVKPA